MKTNLREGTWLLILWIILAVALYFTFGCGRQGDNEKKTRTEQVEVKADRGEAGKDGAKGETGESCDIERAEGGALITCGTTQVVLFDGQNGKDASSPVVEAVPFCERPDSTWPEVGLRLDDGNIVAFFTDGSSLLNSRLVILREGWYNTTDGSNCLFHIDKEGAIAYD
jgi:hypothetical protein